MDARLNGVHRTIYGSEGNGGLQRDVLLLLDTQRKHVEATGDVIKDLQATMTELVVTVAGMKRISSNLLWWLKFVVTPLSISIVLALLARWLQVS